VILGPASGRPGSGFWSSDHGRFFDRGGLQRLVAGIGRQVADFPYDFHAGGISRASEGRVLTIEVGVCTEADEELRAAGVGIIGAGHRQDPGHVWCGIEFSFDGVAWAAGPGTQRAATLDHKPIDHAMKHNTVIVPDTGEADEVGAVSGGHFGQQVQQDGTVICAELNLVAVFVVVEILNGGIDFRFAIFAHVILSGCAGDEQI